MPANVRLVNRPGSLRAATATTMAIGVMVAGACTAVPLTADEQRAAMGDTTRTIVDRTADGMGTDSIEVTDDASELRACPDGGSQYVYAATIGPIEWATLGSTAKSVLTDIQTQFLGIVSRARTEPTGTRVIKFDDLDFAEPSSPHGQYSVTSGVTGGDFEDVAISFIGAPTGTDEIIVDVTGRTRCG